MAITYTWKVDRVECYPTHEGQTDVIFNVTWSYRGKNDDGVGSSRGGRTDVTFDPKGTFTPFAELTEDVVLGWVKPGLSNDQITQMETEIAGDIDWQIAQNSANNPTSPPLPWGMATPEV